MKTRNRKRKGCEESNLDEFGRYTRSHYLDDVDMSNTYELNIEKDKIRNAQIKPIFRDIEEYINFYPDAKYLRKYFNSYPYTYKYGVRFYPTFEEDGSRTYPGYYLKGYVHKWADGLDWTEGERYVLRICEVDDSSVIKIFNTLDKAKNYMIELESYVPFRLSVLVDNFDFNRDW